MDERQPKPTAIDHLLSDKRISEMTANEYRVLVRQVEIALAKLTRRRSVA